MVPGSEVQGLKGMVNQMKINLPGSRCAMTLVLCALMLSCPITAAGPQGAIPAAANLQVVIPDEPTPLASFGVRTCAAPGTAVESNSVASIDYSNASEGYIMAKYTGSKGKVKFQLTGSNKVTYTYNLVPGAGYVSFPLTSGSGTYTANVFENVSGDSYALGLGASINAQISNALTPYLYPSQYVNFTAGSTTVAQGQALAAGAQTDIQVVTNVYNWVVDNIAYDYAKADSVRSGYLPVVDNILATRTGICFDYAAVIATMLRTQNIPTRMEVGYVTGGTYHAWISVYTSETGWIDNLIQFDGKNWKLMDPTFASSGKGDPTITAFITNNSNYQKVYVY